MTETFRHAQQLRQLREGLDPAVCAMTIHWLIPGVVREWLLNPKTVSLQCDGLAVLDAVLDGFAAESARQERDEAAANRKVHRRAPTPHSR